MVLEVREVQPLKRGKEIVPKVVLEVARGANDDAPHEEPEDAAGRREHEQQDTVPADLVERQPLAQIVDGELQHPRSTGGDGRCHNDAHESRDKSSAITCQVHDQATFGGHLPQYTCPIWTTRHCTKGLRTAGR